MVQRMRGGRKKGKKENPHPIDPDLEINRELTHNERESLKIVLEKAAALKGGIQAKLMQEWIEIAFTGFHVNGDRASRSARTEAMKKIHSEVPEKVLEKVAGVSDQNVQVLQINFALDAVSTDPRVKMEELEDIFAPRAIPGMTEALPAADAKEEE